MKACCDTRSTFVIAFLLCIWLAALTEALNSIWETFDAKFPMIALLLSPVMVCQIVYAFAQNLFLCFVMAFAGAIKTFTFASALCLRLASDMTTVRTLFHVLR